MPSYLDLTITSTQYTKCILYINQFFDKIKLMLLQEI